MPLNYVIYDNVQPIISNNFQFLDDYMDGVYLREKYVATYSAEVHTYIFNFITENPTSENKILPNMGKNGRRVYFQALKYCYKGVSVNARAVLKYEDDIQRLIF